MCAHKGPFGDGPLTCDRTSIHDEDADTGHTYASTSAGDAEPMGVDQ